MKQKKYKWFNDWWREEIYAKDGSSELRCELFYRNWVNGLITVDSFKDYLQKAYVAGLLEEDVKDVKN